MFFRVWQWVAECNLELEVVLLSSHWCGKDSGICAEARLSQRQARALRSWWELSIHSFTLSQHHLLHTSCLSLLCALGRQRGSCSWVVGGTKRYEVQRVPCSGVAELKIVGTKEMGPRALPEGQPRFSGRAWGRGEKGKARGPFPFSLKSSDLGPELNSPG